MDNEVILTINPGSTSTKVGLFNRSGAVKVEKIDHAGTRIAQMHSIKNQLPLRLDIINQVFKSWLKDYQLVAVVGRGGLIGPIKSGVYRVNDAIVDVTINCRYATHASNLGASIARGIAQDFQVPAYIVDPVTVDEFIPEARISGVPEIERRSRLHALNINACIRKAAHQLGRKIGALNFVAVHLGGGVSVAAIKGGRIIDCNDALLGMGPFSPERAGALPLEGLIKMARSKAYTLRDLKVKLTKNSGLKGYLGTNDVREVIQRIEAGDQQARLIYDAMIFQIAKEMGAMATTLAGKVDRLIITGGMAHSSKVVNDIFKRVAFIADKIVFPGENELESMAEGGFLAVDRKVKVKTYQAEQN